MDEIDAALPHASVNGTHRLTVDHALPMATRSTIFGVAMSTIEDIYPDFDTALAACGDGYSDADIAEVVACKAAVRFDPMSGYPEQALNSIVALGLAAGKIASRPLSVLDYGGGCGFHYFQAQRVFGDLRWAIVESDAMATRARLVGEGKFAAFSDVTPALAWLGTPDLVHTSGTLQCVPDPIASLKRLLSIQSPYFMLARYPVWRGATRVGVQISRLSENGIGPMPVHVQDRIVRYPNTFIEFDRILEIIKSSGYQVMLSIPSPTADYMVSGVAAPGTTIFCCRGETIRSTESGPHHR